MNDTKKLSTSFEEMDEDLSIILDKANEKNIEYNNLIEEAIEHIKKKYKQANIEDLKNIRQIFGRQQRAHELTFIGIIRYIDKMWQNKQN